jgi:hypothetical protein
MLPVVRADDSWVRDFMACQGQVVLANYLLAYTQRRGRAVVDSDMELELLKCLKTSLSNKVSIRLASPLTPAWSR